MGWSDWFDLPLVIFTFSSLFFCVFQNQQELGLDVMNKIKLLRERIDKEGANIVVQKLIPLLGSLKVGYLSDLWIYSGILLK